MRAFRTVLFWIHLSAGSAAGIFILIMSVSGVLLAYERQLLAWSDRAYRIDSSAALNGGPLPVGLLVEKVREADGRGRPSSLLKRSDRDAPAEVSFGRDRVLLVNPYTGAVLGPSSPRLRGFFRTVEDWHRWLGTSGKNHMPGRALTGASSLIFLGLIVSGLYLWLPRKWTWQHTRPSVWFRAGLSGRARDWNWHNTLGIWCALPLLLIVGSGVVMSFPWANNLVYQLSGSPLPGAPSAAAREPRPAGPQQRETDISDLDLLWNQAARQVADWKTITVRLPSASDATVVFTIDRSAGGHPEMRSQLALRRASGQVARWETFPSYNRGRQIRSWLRFAHTGEVGGVIGQTVAMIASAGGAVLVWTGLALAIRRFWKWRVVEKAVAGKLPAKG